MAVDDSRLYAATARSLWAMADPAGGMQKVSDAVGCVGADAWCVADGVIYTLSGQGLYRVVPGEAPVRVDGEMPQALKGCSTALLGYDPEEDAIHIFTNRGDYFYEIAAKAFWPVSMPTTMRPVAVGRCVSEGVDTFVLCGGDGVWRRFSAAATKDGAVDMDSYVAIGPFRTSGRDDEDGMLDTLHIVLAEVGLNESESVAVEVYPARTAEAALRKCADGVLSAAEPAFSATVGAGFNHTIRPRVRGAWCVVVLRGTGRWAFETATAECKTLGRLR